MSAALLRIAVLSDIHGNLPALEAVLADLEGRSADRAIDLGDCVSGPLWPAETADLLMRRGLPTVRGNHDRWVSVLVPERLSETDRFAREALSEHHLQWLRSLPPEIALSNGIAAVHGSPGDDTSYLTERVEGGRLVVAPEPEIEARLQGLEAALVLCGHSHQPRVLRLADGRVVVNPGSIGNPAFLVEHEPRHLSETCSPHARYAIVTLSGDRVAVDLIAVPYDHVAAPRCGMRPARLGASACHRLC